MDINPVLTNRRSQKPLPFRPKGSRVGRSILGLILRLATAIKVASIWIPILALHIAIAQTTTTITHHRTKESDSTTQVAEAERAIEKRDYATAKPLLQKAIEANPENYEAWFDLGFVFHAMGQIDDSIFAYRKSVAANPRIFESNLNLGLTLAQSHNPDAEKFLRAATTLKPTAHVEEGRAGAWLSLAHLLETTNPNEALEAYRKAALLQPANPEPHLSAGAFLEKQNRLEEAEQEYRDALKSDPSSSDATVGLTNAYLLDHKLPMAEEMLRKLAALHPNDSSVRAQLGKVLAAEGKKDDAIAELETSLKLRPDAGETRRDLADLYLDSAKYDQAEPLYRSILLGAPKDAELHDGMGKILLHQHKFPEAQQEFLTAVQLKPDFGPAYGDLAVAANENKNYALAIKAADARANFMPEIPISFFLRATAYDHLRDKKNAALNYHQFLIAANGQFPDQEWQARQRLKAIEPDDKK